MSSTGVCNAPAIHSDLSISGYAYTGRCGCLKTDPDWEILGVFNKYIIIWLKYIHERNSLFQLFVSALTRHVTMAIMWRSYLSSHIILIPVWHPLPGQGPVSLRLMTSQFKDIVTHTQKSKTVKCKFCGVWVQNFVWNFKGALWNFTQNFEPIHRKICILQGSKNFTTYDILKLWHLKS